MASLQGSPFAISDASLVYLVPVVLAGIVGGTWAAMATAVGAFLTYDLLFIEPRLTVTIDDPKEWLELLLFLFVAVAIGRLAGLQGERAREAAQRAHEAQALFAISRILATTPRLEEAAPPIVERLVQDAGVDRVWISLEHGGRERIVADSHRGLPRPGAASVWSLTRTPGDLPAAWVRLHLGHDKRRGRTVPDDMAAFRVGMESGGQHLGYLYAARDRKKDLPAREQTRLLALAGDQVALALRREHLAREATEAEIMRRSDALKTALLDSVSHDFRTPLASIRAAAGGLTDPTAPVSSDVARSVGRTIEAEVDRLSRLVNNLLDASRIESGALRSAPELFELGLLIEPVVARYHDRLDGRSFALTLQRDLPPVRVDPIFFDQVLGNLLDNAVRHTPADAPIRVRARRLDGDFVELSVEDGGPGVSAGALPMLFDKFYRSAGHARGGRRGLGLGLSVVRGLVEAMGGQARAARSELGGLAVHLALPAGPEPPEEEPMSASTW